MADKNENKENSSMKSDAMNAAGVIITAKQLSFIMKNAGLPVNIHNTRPKDIESEEAGPVNASYDLGGTIIHVCQQEDGSAILSGIKIPDAPEKTNEEKVAEAFNAVEQLIQQQPDGSGQSSQKNDTATSAFEIGSIV